MLPDLSGLRLLIVGNWPPPAGGVSVHVSALRDAARKSGAAATVLDIGTGQNELPGVKASGGEVAFAARLARQLASSDLVHVHTSGANVKSWTLMAVAGVASRAFHVPAIVTLHSGHCPRYVTTTARALVARGTLSAYERVVCVSDEISRTLSRVGAAERRHLIAPAFGLEGLSTAPLSANIDAFVRRHHPILSAMLAPAREYGAAELLGAFARLRKGSPEAGLVVFGPGTEKMDGAAILALGEIERARALGVMKASSVFVRPTLVDGDAVSVREALALRTRVVATRVGTRPSGVVLCAPEDPIDLARALDEALRHPSPVTTPVQDGIEAVLHLYASLLGAPNRMPRAA